jgi:DNA-binding NarL/FixJ family response regulator
MKILVVDDHQIVANGLCSLLSENTGFEVAEARNGTEALHYISVMRPELVILDVEMPGMSGIEVVQRVKQQFPEVRLLMLSMLGEPSVVRRLLTLGADGYLLKNTDREELLEAVEKVVRGERYLAREVAENLQGRRDMPPKPAHSAVEQLSLLTERELEIVRLLAQGLNNREIGEQLGISHRTVDTHRTHLMRKLDVNNLAGVMRFAFQNGLA